MDFDYVFQYVGKFVKIVLQNNYFYKGKVIDVGDTSLVIIDITGKKVVIGLNSITLIEEAEK